MKKKIAVFLAGWAHELAHNFIKGVIRGFRSEQVDLYVFLAYPTYVEDELIRIGELNIFNLPDLTQFDGAILVGNLLDYDNCLEALLNRCEEAGIPTVVTGHEDDYPYCILSDNYEGACDLVRHLVVSHKIRSPYYIAGNKGNHDSDIRLKAIKSVMAENKLKFNDSNVFYSDWEQGKVLMHVRELLSRNKGATPDAIICANDIIAMITCRAAEECGYRVPADLIVTGFDYDYLAQVFSPSIASLDQRFGKIGEEAAITMLRAQKGLACEKKQYIRPTFYPSESCGCNSIRDHDRLRRELGKNMLREYTDRIMYNQNLISFEDEVSRGDSFAEFRENLVAFYTRDRYYVGDSFHIVLEPAFEASTENSGISFRQKGYSSEMDVIFSMERGRIASIEKFDTSKLIPQMDDDHVNRLFILQPLHEYTKNYGYVVFCDDVDLLTQGRYLFDYTKRLNLILSDVRRHLSLLQVNRRLVELTETDALTSVKNRTAYESKEEELNMKIRGKLPLEFALAFFDVNNLKIMNDEMGHSMGDEYIIRCCSLLCKTFKWSPIYRIGGDEFVAILTGEDYANRDSLMKSLREKIQQQNDNNAPRNKKLLFACGMATYDPESDKAVLDVFERADTDMYANKAQLKRGHS